MYSKKIEFSSVACQVDIPLQIVKMDRLQNVLPPHKCTSMQMKFSCSLNQCNFHFLLPSTIWDLFCLKIKIFVAHLVLLPNRKPSTSHGCCMTKLKGKWIWKENFMYVRMYFIYIFLFSHIFNLHVKMTKE